MRALLLLLPLAAGCSQLFAPGWNDGRDPATPTPADDDDSAPADDDDGSPAPTPLSIACTPPQPSYTYAFQQPPQLQLSATVAWSDGNSTPAVGATWAMQDGFGGSLSGAGLYTAPFNHGGRAVFEVFFDGVQGSCSVDLFLQVDVDDLGIAGIFAAADAAGELADPACAPTLLYPPTGAMLPRNFSPLDAQWTPGSGGVTHLVEFVNDYATLRYVTAASSRMPSVELWRALTDSWSGARVSVRLRSGTYDVGTGAFVGPLCASAPSDLTISMTGLDGTVFYWAAAAAGIYRLDVGALAPTAWADTNNTGWCVGCHTTNLAKPRRVAKVYGGGDGWMVVSDIDGSSIGDVMPAEQRPGNFAALSPDGTRLVRSYRGALYVDDLDNNVNLGTLPTSGHATHPNWSPDGNRLVYSSCTGTTTDDWAQWDCSIRRLDQQAPDQWGNDTLLVAADSGASNYYPSFSPDSTWIAFNRAVAEDTYDAVSAALFIVPAAGGAAIELGRGNLGANQTNSWARWADEHGDVTWLAFASRRPYGAITGGIPQVWIVAIDPAAAVSGVDPSFPALWLPGQDPSIGNHTPVWVPRLPAVP